MSTSNACGFAERMMSRTSDALAEAHRGVKKLVFTDFPDHDNVGDSAIALGLFRFYRESGIEVRSAHCIGTSPRSFGTDCAVALHGGGNLGGLYPDHDVYRFQLAETLPEQTLLIQEPQTAHFVSERSKQEFMERMLVHENLRVIVRDQESYDALEGHVEHLFLTPDAAHLLGKIGAPDPVKPVLYLLRNDGESGFADEPLQDSVDWPHPRGTIWVRSHWHNTIAYRVPRVIAEIMNPSPRAWENVARRRLSWGISLLSAGETIITDRLHAVILGLQMGRRVIAIDNNNRKLSRYAETWLDGTEANIEFARGIADAQKRL